MGVFADLSGRRFHFLTVTERSTIKRGTCVWWVCACDCGKTTIVRSADLNGGHVKSCGCYRVVSGHSLHFKHGATAGGQRAPEYRIWKAMKNRCYNTNSPDYDGWGGRGIRVCDEWRHSYDAFLHDVGNRPSPKHSIDRIDNDGDYAPGNVRWADTFEQASNRRPRKAEARDHKGRFISSAA